MNKTKGAFYRMKNIILRLSLIVVLAIALLLSSACGLENFLFTYGIEEEYTEQEIEPIDGTYAPVTFNPARDGRLDMYFIDVGQGDSALLISPSGKTMLIDAGEKNSYSKIAILLESLEIEELDAVVATHPHSDHIGAMADVISDYPIGEFYMPEYDYDTKTYENMMSALDEADITPTYIYGGEDSYIEWDEDVTVQCLSPLPGVDYEDTNDVSIMLRFTFGVTSAMFTGDCEKYAEETVLSMLSNTDFSADVLKVGHHGSSTSSCEAFLNAVNPEYAVISCAWDNSYGHPHDETLSALEAINASIMRTDEEGTIHLALDGHNVLILSD